MPVTFLVVDDFDVVREGLILMLHKHVSEKWKVCGEAANGLEACVMADQLKPDIIIMDVSMPPTMDGLETSRKILKRNKEARIVILTMHRYMPTSLLEEIGVKGFIYKANVSKELVPAIEIILKGGTYFGDTYTGR